LGDSPLGNGSLAYGSIGVRSGRGRAGLGIIHSFDLLATQEAFDEVAGLSFSIENDGHSCITIEGKIDKQDVAVLIYITPFEDTEDDDEIIEDNTFDEEQ
jgi:hypothetical protein